eukprot:3574535-Alexandrium_andersonii.AAC.1
MLKARGRDSANLRPFAVRDSARWVSILLSPQRLETNGPPGAAPQSREALSLIHISEPTRLALI